MGLHGAADALVLRRRSALAARSAFGLLRFFAALNGRLFVIRSGRLQPWKTQATHDHYAVWGTKDEVDATDYANGVAFLVGWVRDPSFRHASWMSERSARLFSEIVHFTTVGSLCLPQRRVEDVEDLFTITHKSGVKK